MFGDDLKKSLESIQVSDELLEKTRKSIEAARLEQAKNSLESASKKSFSSGKYMRVVALAACAVLVGIGLFAVLPHLSAKKDSEQLKSGGKYLNMDKNAGVDQIAENLDDSYFYAETTMTRKYEDAEETQIADEAEDVYAEATRPASQETVAETTANLGIDISDDMMLFSNKCYVNGQTLSVKKPTQDLIWGSTTTKLTLPAVTKSSEQDVIEGIAFSSATNVLGMVISSPSSETLPKGSCTLVLFELDGNNWTEKYSISQTGSYDYAYMSNNGVFLQTKYEDETSGDIIAPAIKPNGADWTNIGDSVKSSRNGRGGTYSVLTMVTTENYEFYTEAKYS